MSYHIAPSKLHHKPKDFAKAAKCPDGNSSGLEYLQNLVPVQLRLDDRLAVCAVDRPAHTHLR